MKRTIYPQKNKLKHLEKKQTIYTFANDFDV